MRVVAAISIVMALACSRPAMAQDKGDASAGRKVAATHCTRCHVVGDINPTGGISSTPSFQLIVRRRPDYKDRFQSFFALRPHPAFLSLKSVGRIRPDLPPNAQPVELTEEDIANMLAYVETLRPKDDAARAKAKMPLVLRPRPKPRVD